MKQLIYATFFAGTCLLCYRFVAPNNPANAGMPVDTPDAKAAVRSLIQPLVDTVEVTHVSVGMVGGGRSLIMRLSDDGVGVDPATRYDVAPIDNTLYRLAAVAAAIESDSDDTDHVAANIARSTHRSIERTPESLRTLVLEPMGMTATTAEGSGLTSTADDMMRLLRSHLDPQSASEPIRRAIESGFEKRVPAGPNMPWERCAAWAVARDGSTRFAGPTRDKPAAMFINRDLGLGVFVLADAPHPFVTGLAEQIMQFGAGMPVEPKKLRTAVEVDAEAMDRLVGRYELNPNFVFDVRREADQLTVGVTGQARHPVFPTSETEWFYKVVAATLTFEDFGDDGRANRVVLDQNGIRQSAERIE